MDRSEIVEVSSTRSVKGRHAPTMLEAEPHGFVSIAAVTEPVPVLVTAIVNTEPDAAPIAAVVLPASGACSVATFVVLPKQDEVPAGHSAVPGKKSQQSPLAEAHGPREPVHTAQTDVVAGGSEKSVHSDEPTGHVVVLVRNEKHTPLACWHGPLDELAQAGQERDGGASNVSLLHTNAPAGHRPSASAAAAHVPLPKLQTPEPLTQGGHTHGVNPVLQVEPDENGAHKSVPSCWQSPEVPA
jgi:hypothetical protein